MRAGLHAFPVLMGFSALTQTPVPVAPPVATERVEGRVVDLRGEPLVATLVLTGLHDPDTVLARGATDGDGWFVIGRVPVRDTVRITATAAGHCGVTIEVGSGSGGIVLRLPESVRVTGRVVDRAGAGVPAAIVSATLAHTRWLGGARDLARSDADGRFELANAPLGLTSIAAVIPGVGLALQWRHLTADTNIDLGPPSGPSMEATIEIAGLEGLAPAGSYAELTTPNPVLPRLPPPWDRVPLTDGGGLRIADLPAAAIGVALHVPGFRCQPPAAELRPERRRLRFQLSPLESLAAPWTGTLRDADGKALARVGLELTDLDSGLRTTTTTDADGNWRIAASIPAGKAARFRCLLGDVVLDYDGPEVVNDPQLAIQLRFLAPPPQPLELRAMRGATVTGVVVAADGEPAAQVTVVLERFEPRLTPAWRRCAWTTTDRQGGFLLRGVHPVPVPVRLSVAGLLGQACGPEFVLDSPAMKVALAPLRLLPPAVVEGDVRDAAGTPVPGVRVWLRDWDKAMGPTLVGETLSDRLGRYRFQGVALGRAVVQVSFDHAPPVHAPDVPPFEVETGKVVVVPLGWPPK